MLYGNIRIMNRATFTQKAATNKSLSDTLPYGDEEQTKRTTGTRWKQSPGLRDIQGQIKGNKPRTCAIYIYIYIF